MEGSFEMSDLYSPSQWEPQESQLSFDDLAVVTPQRCTPSSLLPIDAVTPHEILVASPALVRSRSQRHRASQRLPLLQLGEWDPNGTYDDDPPTCVHYSLGWQATVNGNHKLIEETERKVVLAPKDYWKVVLRSRLLSIVDTRRSSIGQVSADETVVTAVINHRSELKFSKHFSGLEIDWTGVEAQLVAWSGLVLSGKRIRLAVHFRYVAAEPPEASRILTRNHGRGCRSATQRMLAERSARVQAEEVSTGQISWWTQTYQAFRCGTSCRSGPHCWRDPQDGKHYKLYTPHLQQLVELAEYEQQVPSHADVPEALRQELYTEAEAANRRKRSKRATSSDRTTPVTINNHFVEPVSTSIDSTAASSSGSVTVNGPPSPLILPEPLDLAVRDYTEWQQSRYAISELRDELGKVGEEVLSQGVTLDHIYHDGHVQISDDLHIKPAILRRFTSPEDIKTWSKRPRRE